MHGFARLVTTWIAVAFFAAASVTWASAGPVVQPAGLVASMDHGDHDHAAANLACSDQAGCTDPAGHSHTADSTCCAFACHVVADVACSAALARAAEARVHEVVDPAALLGAAPVGPERPPRAA
jgi:hypothetical protein